MKTFTLIEFSLSICLLGLLSALLYRNMTQHVIMRHHVHTLQKKVLEEKSWMQHVYTLINEAEQCTVSPKEIILSSEEETSICLKNGHIWLNNSEQHAFFSSIETMKVEVIHHTKELTLSSTFTPNPEQPLPIALQITLKKNNQSTVFSFFFKRSSGSLYKVPA